jgi:hypothetical protein
MLHLKLLKKQEQANPKTSRMREIIKVSAENSETEAKKPNQPTKQKAPKESMKQKAGSLKK